MPTNKTQKALAHFVKFRLTSLDGLWTSHLVSAFVAPGLCVPIILGLPFLKKNKIICDHEMRTCIHKPSNYNLLNPVERKPHPLPKPCLHNQIKTAQKNKQTVLQELVNVVATKWLPHMGPNKPVKQIDTVISINIALLQS